MSALQHIKLLHKPFEVVAAAQTHTAVTDVAEINNSHHHLRISSPTFAAAGAGGAGAAGAVCPGRCEVRSLQAR